MVDEYGNVNLSRNWLTPGVRPHIAIKDGPWPKGRTSWSVRGGGLNDKSGGLGTESTSVMKIHSWGAGS